MTLKSVPMSSLLPPKGNPRHRFDPAQIASLAQSIRTDGVLQNLVVVPEGRKFRIVFGKRRFLALQQLKKEKAIDPAYPVPVDIKRGLDEATSMRLATVENVQREPLHPLDEADAFATLLRTGGTIEEIGDETGLSAPTIKRRLALANLCDHAKEAVYAGAMSLRMAEALTLGSESQQKTIVENIKRGHPVDADEIRAMFLDGKPTAQMAIFPRDRYTGTITADLFADEETTYFDDTEQFFELQKDAIEALAQEHRKDAAFVDVLNLYAAPWWQYRKAKKRERGGVVINLHPTGAVEIREGLAREAVKEEVVVQTREEPRQRERPAFSAPLLRYVAHHKSAAVQAALLMNPRKAKEAAACLLLWRPRSGSGISLQPHACIAELRKKQPGSRTYREVETAAAALADRLGLFAGGNDGGQRDGVERLVSGELDASVWTALGNLADAELDRLLVLLPILCFGQDGEQPDTEEASLFNRVAADLGLAMRDWWMPDSVFLSSLRREQLIGIVKECNLTHRFPGCAGWSKTELVEALARLFASASDAAANEDSCSARAWLPGVMRFPAVASL